MHNTNTPTIFTFKNQQIRTVTDEQGEPWFVAKDVCDILDLGNITEALRGLDEDELTSEFLNSGDQLREMKVISESGLYTLIIRSNKPQAKPFRRWVTREVLPAIRKHGYYCLPELDPDSNMLITGPAPVTVGRIEEAARGVKAGMTMARSFGFKERVARQLANEMVKEVTGIDALRLLNAPDDPEEPAEEARPQVLPGGDDWLEKQMVAEFTAQGIEEKPGGRLSAPEIYEHFVGWFAVHNTYGLETPSFLSFCRRFSSRFRRIKSCGKIFYIDLGLVVQPGQDDEVQP